MRPMYGMHTVGACGTYSAGTCGTHGPGARWSSVGMQACMAQANVWPRMCADARSVTQSMVDNGKEVTVHALHVDHHGLQGKNHGSRKLLHNPTIRKLARSDAMVLVASKHDQA